MSTTSQQIHGVANLLEGEGHFTFRGGCPVIQLAMTDEDVVIKARSLMAPSNKISIYHPKNGWKTKYTLTLSGSIAAQWMMTIYSLMGRRRKEKIREIIQQWKEVSRKQKNTDYCVKGHPLLVETDYYIKTYVKNSREYTQKVCRVCAIEYSKEHKERTKTREAIKSIAISRNISMEEAEKFLDQLMKVH